MSTVLDEVAIYDYDLSATQVEDHCAVGSQGYWGVLT